MASAPTGAARRGPAPGLRHRLRPLLSAVAGAAASCAEPMPPHLEHAPNVLLISLDTLRADHLSCYGYPRPTSPRIDELASASTRYSLCLATAPWTVPSHASLFTGLFPFEHGAYTLPVRTKVDNAAPLSEERLTLAEALDREGYRTGAFVANKVYLSRELGFAQGFDTYEVERMDAERITERALKWIRARRTKRFFLFLNYMSTHAPYDIRQRAGSGLPACDPTKGRALIEELCAQVMGGDGPVPADVVERIVGQYDTAIANVDASVGTLLDGLRDLDLFDDTLVVLTSDHGEYFGEHRLVEHSKDVYQEALWVPLLVKRPGQREGTVEQQPVSLVDVPALVVDALPEPLRARCAADFPRRPGGHPLIAENRLTRSRDLFERPWGRRFARVRTVIWDWPYKYIHSSDGRHELYDLSRDPGELADLALVEPETAERLSAALEAFQASRPKAVPEGLPELSEAQLRDLRELGYF